MERMTGQDAAKRGETWLAQNWPDENTSWFNRSQVGNLIDAAVAEAVKAKDDALIQVTDERDEMARLNEGLRSSKDDRIRELEHEVHHMETVWLPEKVAEAVKERDAAVDRAQRELQDWMNSAEAHTVARVAEARREERAK